MRRTNDSDDFTGQRLPGTGGDFLDTSDVEGHIRRDGEGIRRDGGPDELYRGGPTTQGEVLRRGPSDNPHAD